MGAHPAGWRRPNRINDLGRTEGWHRSWINPGVTNFLRLLGLAVLVLAALATPAFAQDPNVASGISRTEPAPYVPTITVDPDDFLAEMNPSKRPSALVPLYMLQGVLQGVDAFTTIRGMKQGQAEQNPIFRGHNAGVMLTTKLIATTSSIFMAEKMWKKNKAAAIAIMVASNLVTSAVVANNYRTLSAR